MKYAVNESAINVLDIFSDVLINSSEHLKDMLAEIHKTIAMQSNTLGPHATDIQVTLWDIGIKASETRIIAEQIKMVVNEYRKVYTG